MKTIKIFAVLGIFTLIISQSCSQNKSSQSSTQQNRGKLIDSLFNTAVKENEIPGAVVFINHNGKVVFHKSYGYRNIENKVPMRKDDIFRMASMTKALTAIAVLLLQMYPNNQHKIHEKFQAITYGVINELN